MKCDRSTFVAALLLLGFFVLGLSVDSLADEKNPKTVAKDVKFACTKHGPAHMTLSLSPEEGKAREIKIMGGMNTMVWVVKIGDGKEEEVANGSTVKVHSGDSITWSVSVATRSHGVVFADQDLAEALLDFDKKASKELKSRTGLGDDDAQKKAWEMFGSKLSGTAFFPGVVDLAKCKVK
jgi:plastocyanin